MERHNVLQLMFKQWATRHKLKGRKLKIAKQSYSLGIINQRNYQYENKLGLIYDLDYILDNVPEINVLNYTSDDITVMNDALIEIFQLVTKFKKERWNK